MSLDILYLDNHLLVVNKAAGMLTQADPTGDPDLLTLAKTFIKEKYDKPGKVYLGLVHRLDRPVSGVIVLARTSKAAARLSEQFRRKTPRKRYIAIVEGECRGAGICRDHLYKADRTVRVVAASHPKGKYAELHWQFLSYRKSLSALDVHLKTGRPHQIRVQLAFMGFPVLGDFRYGAKKEFDGRNLALHCYSLTIGHPVRKEKMSWKASPPASWKNHFDDEIQSLIFS